MTEDKTDKEIIKILRINGYVDMSTLNPDTKYLAPTYGYKPFKKDKSDFYSAEKFVRIETWH